MCRQVLLGIESGVLLLLGQQHLGMCCMCNQCLESQ